MVKKHTVVALALLVFLSIAPIVFAGDAVTLPNPLAPAGITTISGLIDEVIKFVSGIIGVLATLMFLISGIMFVTAGGSAERIGTAKKVAIYAGVGLAIALLARGLSAVINAVINP